MPETLQPGALLSAVLAAAVVSLLVSWLRARAAASGLRARLEAAEAELASLRSAPVSREFRIESHGVLWYPVVTADRKSGEIVKTVTGLPHCAKCKVPLKAQEGGGDFRCAACGFTAPGSIVDVRIADQVAAQAAGYYQERRQGS